MKTCAACQQADIPDAARFCPECGAALPAPPGASTAQPGAAPTTTIEVKQDVGQLAGGKATGVELGGVTGDVTVNQQGDSFRVQLGNVGGGAQIAVGKQISQSGAGPVASPADRAELIRGLQAVRDALGDPGVPADRQLIGGEFLRQIELQLTRDDGPPDAATLKVAGDWLLSNIPSLAPSLGAVFNSPAGRRALAAAQGEG